MSRILLVDNEQHTLNILYRLLKTEGYKVVSAGDVMRARELIHSEKFDLMITTTTQKTPGTELDLLTFAHKEQSSMPVIVICENVAGRQQAEKTEPKPFGCMEKPLKLDQLLTMVQKAVDYSDAALTDSVNLNLQLETVYQFENIVAESPAMKSVCDMVSRIAGTDVTVLIFGERGTGKTLLAETIHAQSRRAEESLVICNCSDTNVKFKLFGHEETKGDLETADSGTLLLKEIEELADTIQKRLLRSLQERKVYRVGAKKGVTVDARVIASTTKNLEKLVEQGSFDGDLYKFLKIIPLTIPPLRQRCEDIMPIVRQILRKKLGADKALPSLEPEATRMLEKYPWPGNISEMKKVLFQALEKAEENKITKACLPPEITG
jgi:DNA-binding NtrC family response regulator